MSALKEQLAQWFHDRGFKAKHLRWERHEEGHRRVVFATTKNNYFVVYKDTYLGLSASSRLTRPVENWTQGNDLPDGSFSKETFDKMIAAVLPYELREVSNVASGGWLLRQDDGCGGVEVDAVTEGGAVADTSPCAHGDGGRDCDEHCVCDCHRPCGY